MRCVWWASSRTSSPSGCACGSIPSGTRRSPSGCSPPAASSPTRFAREQQETAVEFFDRDRFSSYASIGENILFGHSSHASLGLEHLAEHPHFRAVIAEAELEGPLVELGADVARDMVEIFKDIAADNELFARFSLLTASELPEYAQMVARVGRDAGNVAPADRDRLIRLALRLIPARHRLGRIDDAVHRQSAGGAPPVRRDTAPESLRASFVPYDRERYFADGSLLDNLLFGKVVATSSLAVKKVNAIVEEVLDRGGPAGARAGGRARAPRGPLRRPPVPRPAAAGGIGPRDAEASGHPHPG